LTCLSCLRACTVLRGRATTAAYRSGYEGEDAHGSDTRRSVHGPPGRDDHGARRDGLRDVDVVDRAVQGDPERRGDRDETRRGEGRVAREDRGREGEDERRGEEGREGRDRDDEEGEREQGREREEIPGDRERRGGERDEAQPQRRDGDGGERRGEERQGEDRHAEGRGAVSDVPTDEYRRRHERRTRERLNHDLARDTGRGLFLPAASSVCAGAVLVRACMRVSACVYAPPALHSSLVGVVFVRGFANLLSLPHVNATRRCFPLLPPSRPPCLSFPCSLSHARTHAQALSPRLTHPPTHPLTGPFKRMKETLKGLAKAK
jgi:hypothetical protein